MLRISLQRFAQPDTSGRFQFLLGWSRRVMLLRSREDLIMRRGFPFVIIRLPIIFAHRIVFKLVPHQNPAQIGMTIEPDAIEIEDLALLKLGAAPDRRKRWQVGTVCAIS